MIATLTIALPTAGVGGELVVRHRQREAVIETHVEEPSELAFAAFYADCTHETRPVRAGHRLSLVFNLCVSGDDDLTPRHAPDYADHVDRIAAHLARWGGDETASNKLVWLLDHDYSEAGLSFRALKNGDANLARALIQSATQAECELFAAIVHIRDHGDATYHGSYVDSYGNWREEDADDMEFNEIFDSQRWLDRWTAPDGRQPPFDEAPLLPGELLPAGALDGAPPDKQWLHEASGNEGVTLERAYRRAAFVIWPRSKTLEVLADAGINNAVDWVAEALAANDGVPNEKIDQFCRRLIHVWPANRYAYGYRNAPDHVRMLDLLAKNGREAPVRRFLHDVVLGDYRGTEDHQAIMGVSHLIPPDAVGKFLAELTQTHFAEKSEEVLALLRLALERYQSAGDIWREPLQDCVRSALAAFGTKLRDAESDDFYYRSYGDYGRRVFGAAAIRDLFLLAWRCGSLARGTSAEDSLTSEAEQAARLVANRTAVVEPQRELAEALPALYQEDGLSDAPAYGVLWRHATERLLARSETPPVAPRDWRIKTNTGCDCAHCADLRAFCRDPDATATRFSMREDLRSHLESEIRRAVLDIDTKTEKKGRPYTLVCTKNRAQLPPAACRVRRGRRPDGWAGAGCRGQRKCCGDGPPATSRCRWTRPSRGELTGAASASLWLRRRHPQVRDSGRLGPLGVGCVDPVAGGDRDDFRAEHRPQRVGRGSGAVDVAAVDSVRRLDGDPHGHPVGTAPGAEDEVGRVDPGLLLRRNPAVRERFFDGFEEVPVRPLARRLNGLHPPELEPLTRQRPDLAIQPVLQIAAFEEVDVLREPSHVGLDLGHVGLEHSDVGLEHSDIGLELGNVLLDAVQPRRQAEELVGQHRPQQHLLRLWIGLQLRDDAGDKGCRIQVLFDFHGCFLLLCSSAVRGSHRGESTAGGNSHGPCAKHTPMPPFGQSSCSADGGSVRSRLRLRHLRVPAYCIDLRYSRDDHSKARV